jgi:hypothetical protein
MAEAVRNSTESGRKEATLGGPRVTMPFRPVLNSIS